MSKSATVFVNYITSTYAPYSLPVTEDSRANGMQVPINGHSLTTMQRRRKSPRQRQENRHAERRLRRNDGPRILLYATPPRSRSHKVHVDTSRQAEHVQEEGARGEERHYCFHRCSYLPTGQVSGKRGCGHGGCR